MYMVSLVSVFTLLVAAAAIGAFVGVNGGDVTYDGRSLIINGEHKLLFSGSIHYPRSTPEMWPSLIKKAKQGGLDVIDTYAFWNLHEPQQGQYDFSGNKDIVRFFKEVQSQGLYACLRIGPFIESEWNYGGFPFWIHDVPGIVYRSDNEPFKFHMQNFTTYIVNLMKSERLFASQGGPIILSQIENEYQNVERAFHEKGPPYVKWAAEMAVGLNTGVPWAMCKQDDAPDPVINACNGMRCGETFKGPNSPNKPFIWTEDWTSQYQVYGDSPYIRPAEDIAFHVALFLAKKGSFVNYYMYHGGTNFGRTSSAYVVTSYYDQAPLDEYGMVWLPKWGHLRELHAAAKLCEKTLLSGDQTVLQVGPNQQGYVFRGNSGDCAAFLVNNDSRNDATVQFQDVSYVLPRKSISVLPDCRTVAFNTAKVGYQSGTRDRVAEYNLARAQTWTEFKEDVVNFDDTSIRDNSILEHMSTTKDASDYLWYTFKFDHDSNTEATLEVKSLAHVLRAYVNGELIGSAHGGFRLPGPSLDNKISLVKGSNNISLLSVMVGLPDSGPYLEKRVAGLRRVRIRIGNVLKDFSNYPWGYQVGLLGEKKQVYGDQGLGSVQWNSLSVPQPLTWYKTVFNAPRGSDPVALNLGSMGKGEAWVNGRSIGRYWVSYRTTDGSPSQTWYNVPRSFLKPSDNSLVLLEEEGGSPPGISVDTVSISKVCSHVTSSHPPSIFSWAPRKERDDKKHENNRSRTPRIQLHCPLGRNISKILFASFGNPTGDCQGYAPGSCHSPNSKKIVEKACLGRKKCAVPIRNQRFGEDPCPGIDKALLVEAQCS